LLLTPGDHDLFTTKVATRIVGQQQGLICKVGAQFGEAARISLSLARLEFRPPRAYAQGPPGEAPMTWRAPDPGGGVESEHHGPRDDGRHRQQPREEAEEEGQRG
jgi:hypothetical protein